MQEAKSCSFHCLFVVLWARKIEILLATIFDAGCREERTIIVYVDVSPSSVIRQLRGACVALKMTVVGDIDVILLCLRMTGAASFYARCVWRWTKRTKTTKFGGL